MDVGKVVELHHLFKETSRPRSKEFLKKRLDCSEATFHRYRKYLKEKLQAPLIHDRKYGGYRYDALAGDTFELPGLWLSSRETEVLLGFHEAISSLQQGFFGELFSPVKKHLNAFLQSQNLHAENDVNPVRIISQQSRQVDDELFRTCADAVIRSKTLRIQHDKPGSPAVIARTVSPFSIVRYRDNWYLDAYCHLRKELRTFSLDRIHAADVSHDTFHNVSKKSRIQFFAEAYGIFNGPAVNTAQIKFTGAAAEIVAREEWHPHQKGMRTPEGHYLLTIPYGHHHELLADVLKWGDQAEIISPPELRNQIKALLSSTLQHYKK